MRKLLIGTSCPKSNDATIGPSSATMPESSRPILNSISFAAALAASIRWVPWTIILPSESIMRVARGASRALMMTFPFLIPPSLSIASSRSTGGDGVKRTSRLSTLTSNLPDPLIVTPPLHPKCLRVMNSPLHRAWYSML